MYTDYFKRRMLPFGSCIYRMHTEKFSLKNQNKKCSLKMCASPKKTNTYKERLIIILKHEAFTITIELTFKCLLIITLPRESHCGNCFGKISFSKETV